MSVLRTIQGRILLVAALAGALWAAQLPVQPLEGRVPRGVALVERPAGADAIDGDPVDLGTGLFVREDDDLVVAGPPPIRLRRTYRSNDPRARAFGIGTSDTYEAGTPTERTVAYEREAGSSRVRTITVSCTSGGRPQKMSAPVGAGETADDVKSRLLGRCR